jgi:hypothetical protein
MEPGLKRIIIIYIVLRAVIDFILAALVYRRTGTLAVSFGVMLIIGVFYYFLCAGIRHEEFRGRYGQRVILWREPIAFWFVYGFLVVAHLVVTGLVMANLVHQ